MERVLTGMGLVAFGLVLAWLLRPCGMFLDRDEKRQADLSKRGKP